MPTNENRQSPQVALELILKTDIKDIGKRFIESLFASYHDKASGEYKEAPFRPEMNIKLTHDLYPYVKEPILTTLGMLIFNRYVLERTGIIEHLGYWNTPLTSKATGKLSRDINNLLIHDIITPDQLADYIDSRDAIGFWCCAFLGTSVTPALIRPMENVNKRKQELFEQKKEKLTSNNAVDRLIASNEIEAELCKMVNENLKNDPGYDMYASGIVNLANNYKNINVMRGAVYNEITGNFDVVENSLMDGVTKKDIPAFANSVVAGAYPSAVGTAEAGYMAKILLATLQSVELDPDLNSDCGTKSTIPITVTNDNKSYLLYRNIISDNKTYMTDLKNIDSFVGKQIRMYSPQCCLNDKVCAKCAGKVFHNLNVTHVGLLTTEITQKLLNIKLKSKHDLSQSAKILDKNDIFIDKNDYIKIDDGNVITKLKLKLVVTKLLESQSVFEVESSRVMCMGMMPAQFYDNNNNVVLSTMLSIPAVMSFNVYSDPQETPDEYILTYEPGSIVTNVALRQSVANVEYFINQIYLYNRQPIIPYNMMTEMMFRCLEMNKIDLNGPSITYEFLARVLCRDESGSNPFAFVYGRNPNVDQKSYLKLSHRESVQREGALQSILYQDTTRGINVGLAATLDGKPTKDSPLEKIVKA